MICDVVPSVEIDCWGVDDTFITAGSCGDSCMETCVVIMLSNSWSSLSIGITFVEEVSPVSLSLGLVQGKGYSEIGIVFSKGKCVCVSDL